MFWLKNKFIEIKNKLARMHPLRKEILSDLFISTPYVIVDSALYFSTALQFLDSFNKNDDENSKWMKPQYIVLSILASMLAISYYCTFSKTNAKLLGLNNDSIYSKGKNKIRKILGIPSALTKTSIAASALYMFAKKELPVSTALSLSIASWLSALPAMTALLWSELTNRKNVSLDQNGRQNIKRMLKYFFIHTLTLFYALDNTSLYFWSTINIPMRLGIIDHSLNEYKDSTEQFFYYFSYLVAAFPFFAVYISYAHLNENMFGLRENESDAWALIKNKAKKITGPIASVAKVVNAGISTYGFLDSKMPKVPNVVLSTIGSISGLITQYSILGSDPIQNVNDHQDSLGNNNNSNSNDVAFREEVSSDVHNDSVPLINIARKT